nr:immunoglobulin heavy chain junction region [Macaca mulatta]MOV48830.1 immunoglobulin heavy chain junction region [Macaca mulatta]MOV49104.1 immunoglobulin heavy chain junction region [Macaca mulatta]MOV49128.1 immunoglobulin heavy chain junction region [Macaca mulatta]MOV49204.1 immunoglobulin heavy chain junction region [Macaca mulatta]
CARVQSDFDVW